MTVVHIHYALLALTVCLFACAASGGEAKPALPPGFKPKPVPRMQAVPLAYEQVSFQCDGKELTRYHYGSALERPFLYPIIGPAGRSLTRMGHPHDPVGHGHHDSVWTSHHDVAGANFWTNTSGCHIVHQRVEKLEDGDEGAALAVRNVWRTKAGRVLLRERRRVAVLPLPKGEWLLVVDIELAADKTDIVLGKTPFGVFSVRMAKTIGVHDGAGMIRNSEGGVNEKGVFWKRAKWVDYSGAITPTANEGVTLMDHTRNPNHPSTFHVRNDGWMGASLTFNGPRTIARGKPLRLRYGLYVHAGVPDPKAIDERWTQFSRLPLPKPAKKK